MGVRMPGVDGIEATRRIAADPALAGTRVIVLTTFELDEYVFDALRLVASGFLTKDAKPAELLRAVRQVAGGEALVGEGLSNDEVAGRLVVSPATARTYVSRAMVKLGARDRAQLVVVAYRSNLTELG